MNDSMTVLPITLQEWAAHFAQAAEAALACVTGDECDGTETCRDLCYRTPLGPIALPGPAPSSWSGSPAGSIYDRTR